MSSSYTVRPVLGSQGKAVGFVQLGRKQEGRVPVGKHLMVRERQTHKQSARGQDLGLRLNQKVFWFIFACSRASVCVNMPEPGLLGAPWSIPTMRL